MAGIDRDLCRRSAAECVELARVTTDPETKQILLARAQEWLKLAYSEHDAEFERLLSGFNSEQMGVREQARPPTQRMPMQQQPLQQQQSRQTPEEPEDEK